MKIIILTLTLLASSCFAIVTNINSGVTSSTIGGGVSSASSGDTLLVSTGEYSVMQLLNKNLTIIGGYTPDFSTQVTYKATILYGGGYAANFVNSTSVIEGLTFTDTHNNALVIYSSLVTARYCSVKNNISHKSGAGVKISGGGFLLLDHSVVENNSATGTIYGSGGGVYVYDGGTLIVSRYSQIRNNYAEKKGGGIFVGSSGYVEVQSSSLISKNVADEAGGGVYINNGELYLDGGAVGYIMSDPNSTSGDGGGIYAKNASVVFKDSKSDLRNSYAGNNGGGIFLTNSSLIFCDGSDIGYAGHSKTNYAGGNGGGIYAVHSTVAISNANVFACYADGNGGAIYAYESDVIIYDCEFGNTNDLYTNVSGVDGGAVGIEYGTLFINGTTFQNNQAGDDGGAIKINDTVLTITNTVLRNNIATDYGGALYAQTGTALAEISDSSIITNYGNSGGGIRWNSGNDLTIRSSIINANEAVIDDGGGIFALGFSSILLDDVEMLGNKAKDDGGGILITGDQILRLRDCDVRFNEADSDGNTNGNGGGLVVMNRAELEIIAQNKNVFIGTNQAVNGAGIYINVVNPDYTVDIIATSGYQVAMSGNMASGDGGGIHAVDPSEITLIGDVLIAQNQADNGGGISAAEGAHITLEKSENYFPKIIDCTARERGGAISVVDLNTLVVCDGVNFGGENDGNVSQGIGDGFGGGAVAVLDNAEFNAIDCVFDENESVSDGGAIYVSNAIAIVRGEVSGGYAAQLPSSVFINNSSSGGGGSYGGAIYVHNGYAELYNSAIISNDAQRGGGAYAYFSEIYFENVIFSKNNASFSIGADAVKAFGGAANIRFNYCTIADNDRSGVVASNGGELNMTNCIVWGHTILNVTTNHNVAFSNIEGGYSGTGNIDQAPLFADSSNLDYELTAGSPCKNTGIDIGVTNDCIGIARPQLGGYDMGAYEFIPEPGKFIYFILFFLFGKNKINKFITCLM